MLYRDWLNLQSHLLWCYDNAIVSNREDGPVHRTSDYVNSGAWLVRSGWAQVEYGNLVLRAEPGQWLLVKPGRRVQSFAVDTHLLSVAFEANWPDGGNLLDDGLPLVLDAADCAALERKAKPMVRLMNQISKELWDVRQNEVNYRQFFQLERYLNEWLLVLLDAVAVQGVKAMVRDEVDERIAKAVVLINAQPLDVPLEQAALASRVGLSTAHLSRLFQREIGTTPRSFFEKRRIDHAYRRLRMSDVRIKEVALTLGFTHLSHFSNWFKSFAGQSPRAFLRNARTIKKI